MNLKTQLAPKGLSFNPSDFFISDKYATILSVISYPRVIAPGYLSSLTNMSGIKVVINPTLPSQQFPCGMLSTVTWQAICLESCHFASSSLYIKSCCDLEP